MGNLNRATYLYFFDSKYLINKDDYKYNNKFNDEISEALFRTEESIDNIGILKGAIVLEQLCKKPTYIKGGGNHITSSYSIDENLYYTLLLKLTDSLTGNWHTFSRSRFLNLCTNTVPYIECVVITNITLNLAKKIDNQLSDLEYYIGGSTMDYQNPLHVILFNEYLMHSVRIVNNEICYVDAADINNWEIYYPNYTLKFVDEFVFDNNIRDIWRNNLSTGGLDAVKVFFNKGRDYHHNKVGLALMRAVFEGKIDKEFELEINYPDAESAIVIPRKKLENYALDLTHPDGRTKAKYFKEALSIEQTDWRYMEEQIRLGIHEAEVSGIKIDEHGIKYYADIGVSGRNGVNKVIRTAWIIRKNEPIQLTTLYPLDFKEQFEVNYDIRPLLAVSKEDEKEGADKWSEVYRLANQLGEVYLSECVPTPVFIEGFSGYGSEGLLGWAYINIYDLQHEFIKWLEFNRLGHVYEDYYRIVVDRKGCYEKSVAFAEGVCKVLRANEIDCEVIKHLD
ncbi:DUF6883 domain-containing protein [Paenibacillus sp. PDC88]|uniref:DUF6883 domain-containing protein n=1 Tax=Paenibacillus sp. PDC88 TaxID=1884375 RepID=UPI0008993168|nr:DUF6883 domain-containing protein [Paenibacillus sp. PDC88]SDX41366.1 hypothetical protein SAMN05518848_10765 [Paenibacillus sp. PDC88]